MKITREQLTEMIRKNEDVSNIDISGIKDIEKMFYNSKFNQDVSNWDITNAMYMNNMFSYSAFSQNTSKEIKELKSEIKILQEHIGKLECNTTEQAYTKIECPMKFTKGDKHTSMGLAFQNNQAQIFKNKTEDFYRVDGITITSPLIKTILVPTKKEDCRENDWVFVSEVENPNFTIRYDYKLCLEDKFGGYVCTEGGVNCTRFSIAPEWKYYYKVVEVSE